MKTGTGARRTVAIAAGALASLLIASSAFAMDCVNISKADQSAGVQVVLDLSSEDGQIEWTTPGVAKRLESGVLDPDGEGFHGLIGFDFDGLSDGQVDVDVSTWVGVGPTGDELPQIAQFNGPPDKGLTNICLAFPFLCGQP